MIVTQDPQRQPDQQPEPTPPVSTPDAIPPHEIGETLILDAQSPYEAGAFAVDQLLDDGASHEELARGIEAQQPADAADSLESLEPEDSARVLGEMHDHAAAEALAYMQAPLAVTVLRDATPEYAARLLRLMDPDDAADLLQALPVEMADTILRAMPRRAAARLGKLARYDPETAGGLMTTDFVKLRTEDTVERAIERIRREAEDADLYYLYAVDEQDRLRGVVNLRSLLLKPPGTRIDEAMNSDVVALKATLDQEEVARAFDRYDHVALPVVDDADRLLGVVTIDDVIDTIRAEHTEDALKQVGAGPSESVHETVRSKLRARTPWLVINLLTAQLAASIVLLFTDLIEAVALLAVLMPVVANQSGNAGQQSLAVTLRGLVLGEVRSQRVGRLLLRETAFGVIAGLIVGLVMGLGLVLLGLSGAIDADWRLAVITSVSMAGALAAGCLMGAGMPILMERWKIDPATASTIFLTMLTDSISFLAFLGLAWVLRGWLLPAG